MGDTDLFGEAPLQPVTVGKGSRGGRRPGLHAYPAPPGTGPEGKCCRHCAHKTYAEGTSKPFLKCALMRPAWTHGYGTDIRARSPACAKFQPTRTEGGGEG